MRRFDYFEPSNLTEAVAILGQYRDSANVLAGGTDLLVEIKEQIRRPDHIVNIKKIPGLDRLRFDAADGLSCGSLVTAREVETSADVACQYRGLRQAVAELGSIQVRNRATIAGNICRASPSADTLPPLIAHAATVTAFGPGGERTFPLEEFFLGPGKTRLEGNEILTRIDIPAVPPHSGSVYIKHGRRKAMELATVGVACVLTRDGAICRNIRIVLGAVAPTPIRAGRAETMLQGAALSETLIEQAAAAAMEEARPISNVRGSAAYRREMVQVLTARAVAQAWELAQ